jgi:hypothetical protein
MTFYFINLSQSVRNSKCWINIKLLRILKIVNCFRDVYWVVVWNLALQNQKLSYKTSLPINCFKSSCINKEIEQFLQNCNLPEINFYVRWGEVATTLYYFSIICIYSKTSWLLENSTVLCPTGLALYKFCLPLCKCSRNSCISFTYAFIFASVSQYFNVDYVKSYYSFVLVLQLSSKIVTTFLDNLHFYKNIRIDFWFFQIWPSDLDCFTSRLWFGESYTV